MMNIDELKSYLVEAVSETTENMFFTPAELISGSVQDDFFNELISVKIDILKPYDWVITLLVPNELAQTICEEIFSFDGDTGLMDTNKNDLICEMLNTIAGRLLSKLTDDGEIFEMGLPTMISDACGSSSKAALQSFFQISAGVISLTIDGDLTTQLETG